jgi:hypothetical protein
LSALVSDIDKVETQSRFSGEGERILLEVGIECRDEVDIMVSGEEVVAWDQLEKNAKYSHGYDKKSKAFLMFWKLFEELPLELKRKFFVFTARSDRAPIGGLSNVVITIEKIANQESLPVSHTRFLVFGLPDYPTEPVMRTKVLLALNETEGYAQM